MVTIRSPESSSVRKSIVEYMLTAGWQVFAHKEENGFDYEILIDEQVEFDFIEIIFNTRRDGNFICDEDKGITRTLEKAILYNNGIPYLAPELMLFILCNPIYVNSEYHKEKNRIDFNAAAPFLSAESYEWLVNALKTAYPEDSERLSSLMMFKDRL